MVRPRKQLSLQCNTALPDDGLNIMAVHHNLHDLTMFHKIPQYQISCRSTQKSSYVRAHRQNAFKPSITPEFYIPATMQDRWGLNLMYP